VSSRSRAALLAAAVVVLIVAFVVASSSGGDDDDTTSSTQAAAPASTATTGTSAEQTGGTEAKPATRVDIIRIKDGKNATGDAQKLQFKKGDTVRIRYVSDQAVEAHLHGYDKAVEVPAGGSKTLTFKANADGVYEIENEETGDQLATLEIQP
jgi:FtsP/CotA-like multicopper oxidase with cupredoxin domain